jgi:hypothetical protein
MNSKKKRSMKVKINLYSNSKMEIKRKEANLQSFEQRFNNENLQVQSQVQKLHSFPVRTINSRDKILKCQFRYQKIKKHREVLFLKEMEIYLLENKVSLNLKHPVFTQVSQSKTKVCQKLKLLTFKSSQAVSERILSPRLVWIVNLQLCRQSAQNQSGFQ